MNAETILSLDDKILLLARDIYDHARLNRTAKLEKYQPSKQISAILSETEYTQMIQHLRRLRYISMTFSTPTMHWSVAKDSLPPYSMTIDTAKFQSFLNIPAPTTAPPPYFFDPIKSLLSVRGVVIRLSRTEGSRPLAYHIVAMSVKNLANELQSKTYLKPIDRAMKHPVSVARSNQQSER